jgi:hypothetical protein
MVLAFRPMDSVRCPAASAVWIFSPSGFHRVIAKPVHSETGKQNGCQVATMALSEVRGLSLWPIALIA